MYLLHNAVDGGPTPVFGGTPKRVSNGLSLDHVCFCMPMYIKTIGRVFVHSNPVSSQHGQFLFQSSVFAFHCTTTGRMICTMLRSNCRCSLGCFTTLLTNGAPLLLLILDSMPHLCKISVSKGFAPIAAVCFDDGKVSTHFDHVYHN